MSCALPASLLQHAIAPYRQAGRFAYHFARGKLRADPVFAGLLQHGWIAPRSRVLDLGCGQGLLAAVLLAAENSHAEGHWPAHWQAPPLGCTLRGIDLMPRDVHRARTALGAHAPRMAFECADISRSDFGQADAVVLLDVLHYIDDARQLDVLARARNALCAGGTLLLRVGDKAGGWRFRFSTLVDRIVLCLRGRPRTRLCCHSLEQWQQRLRALGMSEVRAQAMHAGTPFASMVLLARKPL